MQESAAEGTREHKRAQTYRRIHEAAVALAVRDGLAAATVSDIAERAGVSRRTFFNYYPCKEDAILGIREPQIPPRALETFLEPVVATDHDSPPSSRFDAALNLTVATMAANGAQPSAALQTLIAAHPELVERIRAYRDTTQELLVTVLSERLEQAASPRAGDSARALILLAGAVLRFAHHDDPDILDDPDPAAITKAMAAFRHALKEFA